MDVKTLVIGGNHHNTLGVIRSLGEKGIGPDVVIIDHAKHPYIGKSKYIQHLYVLNDISKLIPFMLEYNDDAANRPVVIACSDAVSSELDTNRGKLQAKYMLPGCKEEGRVTHYMNKTTCVVP